MTDGDGAAGIDPRRVSPGRVYDYLLGGKDNFAADRTLADRVITSAPRSPWVVRENRAFVTRAVSYCVERGVRQFLDLGSGLPAADNVHEVARRADPACRVVYVDNDPMVVAHAQALLADGAGVAAINGDVRRPAEVLGHERVRRLIDFSRPVGVLMVAILHFLTDDDDPAGVVAQFMEAVAPASHLVISHASHDARPEETAHVRRLFGNAAIPLVTRTKQEIAALFAGLDLVEPGVVFIPQWRPTHEIRRVLSGPYVGVASKPAPE